MYAQIFLGIFWLMMAVFSWLQKPFMLRKKLRTGDNKGYQRFLTLPLSLFGIIFIVMGIVDHLDILSETTFIVIYICLCIIPLALVLYGNIKYFGKLRP